MLKIYFHVGEPGFIYTDGEGVGGVDVGGAVVVVDIDRAPTLALRAAGGAGKMVMIIKHTPVRTDGMRPTKRRESSGPR